MTEQQEASAAEPGDIVQVDPESPLGKDWGAQLCVVSEQRAWGVLAYFVHADTRGKFSAAYLRLQRGTYLFVGKAHWTIASVVDDVPLTRKPDEEQAP